MKFDEFMMQTFLGVGFVAIGFLVGVKVGSTAVRDLPWPRWSSKGVVIWKLPEVE